MTYKYALEAQDYSDLSAGKVLQSLSSSALFPIRLTSEIFGRCAAQLASEGITRRLTVYDPCCGSAYLLTTLAYLHWDQLAHLIATDIDATTLEIAAKNLALLTPKGIESRITQIQHMIAQFNKPAHEEALASAERLKAQLQHHLKSHEIQVDHFQADALAPKSLPVQVDLIIADVPYGSLSAWQAQATDTPPMQQFLAAQLPHLQAHSLIAVCADKNQKAAHPAFRRVDQFQIGKRRVTLLKRA